ncbi:hypothetical protein DFQ27_002202 [Actinomortierella ambigua]|uniref:Tail specific protease domain-containing protein n=1 Tax=Actinomortierella ambigua TaxID=1343610 RepID=A0A9P6QAZ5_9FUNG|nr:hypothetical protein DFQ27_002202 [Actinomortierella ambigua]
MKVKDAAGWISISMALLIATASSSSLHVEAAPATPPDANVTSVPQSLSGTADPSVASTDPCLIATSAKFPIDYNVAKACLDAKFPFPSDNFEKTVKSLKKLVSGSYIFEDMAADPPEIEGMSFPEATISDDLDDLLDEATDSSRGKPMTPREFHDKIRNIMIRAHDAHLGYQASCFSKFYFEFGFYLGEEWDDERDENVIKVQSSQPSFRELSGMDFDPDGCEIVTIDDHPARKFINKWTYQNLDISKDENARHNRALAGPIFKLNKFAYISKGRFSRRNMLPEKSSLKFGFKCPSTWGNKVVPVNVKWGAEYTGNQGIVSVNNYYTAYCAAREVRNAITSEEGEVEVNGGDSAHPVPKPVEDGYEQVQSFQGQWATLPPAVREKRIAETVQEFKNMPTWLSRRTEEVLLGQTGEGSPSRLEWTDETDEGLLRAQAERILRAIPVEDHVPQLPIFEPQEIVDSSRYQDFRGADTGYTTLLSSPYGLHALLLADKKTGVLIIPTFSPKDRYDNGAYPEYYSNLLQAIDVLRPVAEHLILDVSSNGGGSVCLSQYFVSAFFPDTPKVVSNVRLSKLEAELIAADMGQYFNFLTPQGRFYDVDYLTDKVKHSNREESFTNYLNEYCLKYKNSGIKVDPAAEAQRPRSIHKGYVYDPSKVYYPWDAEDIVIFSDGLCGSACATFTNQLVQKNNVWSIVYGGGDDPYDPFSYSSFPGGQVIGAETYFEYYKELQFSNEVSSGDSSTGRQLNSSQEQQSNTYPLSSIVSQDKRADTGEESGSGGDGGDQFPVRISRSQRKRLLELLPEPFQQSGYFSFAWRQNYNTGNVYELFVQSKEGDDEWVPNWGPDIGQWNEYSFLPATYRIPITAISYKAYHHLWEDARDAVWGPATRDTEKEIVDEE